MTGHAPRDRPAAPAIGRPGTTVTVISPFDPDEAPIGGIASFIRGFAKFAPDDIEIEIVGVSRTAPIGHWRATSLEGRPVRHLPVARGRSRRGGLPIAATFTFGLARYRARISRGGVLQFHRPGTALPLLRRAQPKVRVVHLTVDDLTAGASESTWRRLRTPLAALERRSLAAMDRVYVVNEEAARRYRTEYPGAAERIVYVPNWVDDSIFATPDAPSRAAARAALRARIGAGPDSAVLLFAGRLERQKDPLLALRGFALVAGQRPATQLVVAGAGTLDADVRREAARLGLADRVHLTGSLHRDELAGVMAGSDLLLITSAFETGPTVGLEALAAGLPVVTTHVGTVARIVEAAGAGATISERTPEAAAAAIQRVLALDPEALRTACDTAVAPFRAANVLPQLYEDARSLAARDAHDGVRRTGP